MRKIIQLLFLTFIILPFSANAMLSMELTRGIAGAIPIAVVPFAANDANLPQDVAGVVGNDLQNSGRFKVYGRNTLSETPSQVSAVSTEYFRRLGTDSVVIGRVVPAGNNQYKISFQLVDVLNGAAAQTVLSKEYTVSANQLRAAAHHISDLIYEKITGTRGIFSTRIAYVVVQRTANASTRYLLEISDQDGYDPRQMLSSPEPIMSPAWSPNGKQLAYVSFENQRANIYIQDVASGGRRILSQFSGINGAPAWSPDGRKLAIVLSKAGSPNIYVMDIASGQLTELTHDFYINTEPSWAPNGRSLLFTSNRSGGPQIYQVNLSDKAVSRISYDGDYNARASYTRDGNQIAMIHRVSGLYKIAILDLDSGTVRVLTNTTADSASPSIAPNGSMILYDTAANGRNMLGMVSSDGRIEIMLPARNGDAQDPAWSPFLS